MIEVRVRDDHEVQIWQRRARQRTAHEPQRTERAEPQLHANATEQHGMCENADAVEVDENRRVPDPCERDGVIAPRLRMRRVWCSGYVMADFGEALSKEARAPRRRAAESGHSGLFPHGSYMYDATRAR